MRRLVALLTALLLATAAAAGAGDDIKWKRSKKLKTVPPTSAVSEFGSDVERMESKYMLDWAPYTDRNIDFIHATYYGWRVYAVMINNDLRKGKIDEGSLVSEVEKARKKSEEYVVFFVKIRIKQREFYETTGEDYWTFYSPTANGKTEPVKIEKKSYEQPINILMVFGSPSHNPYGPDYRWYREYEVFFDKAALGEEPRTRKLVIAGGDINRGFEWRFVEE